MSSAQAAELGVLQLHISGGEPASSDVTWWTIVHTRLRWKLGSTPTSLPPALG